MKYQEELRRSFVVLGLCVLQACGSGGSGPVGDGPLTETLKGTPLGELALKESFSCDGIKDYVATSIANLVLDQAVAVDPACSNCRLTAAGATLLESNAVADAGEFQALTGTNTQESGVDELDRIEADRAGNFYVLDGRHLVVANGLPPEQLRELASLKLTDTGHPRGLLLDEPNGRLVAVLSGESLLALQADAIIAPEIWAPPSVELLFINVADPSSPVIERRLSIEGYEVAARRIGSRVHLVSHFTPVIPASIIDDENLAELQQRYAEATAAADASELARQIRQAVAALVAASDGEHFVPDFWLKDGAQDFVNVSDPNCGDVSIPDVSMPFALTLITSVDSDGGNIDSLKVTNNAWNVYASARNIYLMQPSSGWWWDRLQRQQTAIYKVSIGGGAPRYEAFGLVDGFADSSFQFSEHEGHLRVTTNRAEFDPAADRWWRHNNLYVLADDGAGRLTVAGSVLGFGEEERIFSARFLGDRGFVVTFRQIDPLFAFDLSRPTDPRLVGELEIPGVSTYIHPLDDAHLLTIGFDGDERRRNGQMRLQIFDVQDLSSPRLLHAFVPQFDATGLAWTSALYDHHAFNYFDSAGMLTIPVQYRASRLQEHFSGFAAFTVSTDTGFTDLGRIDHSDLARNAYCPDPALGSSTSICDDGIYLESANPSRSLSALLGGETYVYTLSDVGMKVSSAEAFAEPLAVLPLPYPNSYWWIANAF